MDKKRLAVYIHIPFCASKCVYCDFLSFSGCESKFHTYFKKLEHEIVYNASRFSDYVITSVFFGGGTPSIVPSEYILRIFSILKQNYNVQYNENNNENNNKNNEIEVTIEANPETVSFENLCAYRESGINRISFGIQSFSDEILRKIGRIHDCNSAFIAYENAVKAGFSNINIDLMFALPNQTIGLLSETLVKAIQLKPQHISFYGLILEENSALYKDKNFIPIDDETDRQMYEMVKSQLKRAGYKHYEISNFALEGMECKHNIVYWTGDDYIGFGLGAHSFIDGIRFCNSTNLDEYITNEPKHYEIEISTEQDKYAEFFFLGLRLIEGISEAEFFRRYGRTVDDIYKKELENLTSDGLLIRENGKIRLSARGIDLSNMVFENFILISK